MDHLERAHNELRLASDQAGGAIQRQLDFHEEGVFEEDEGDEGDKTQPEPDPHPDRLAKMAEKLDGLAAETEDDTAATYITNAHDALEAAMHEQEE